MLMAKAGAVFGQQHNLVLDKGNVIAMGIILFKQLALAHKGAAFAGGVDQIGVDDLSVPSRDCRAVIRTEIEIKSVFAQQIQLFFNGRVCQISAGGVETGVFVWLILQQQRMMGQIVKYIVNHLHRINA